MPDNFNEEDKDIYAAMLSIVALIDKAGRSAGAAARKLQARIYRLLKRFAYLFEIKNGRYDAAQDYAPILLAFREAVLKLRDNIVDAGDFNESLGVFDGVTDATADLQYLVNNIDAPPTEATRVRQFLRDQAQQAIAGDTFEQQVLYPLEQMLAQQVLTGARPEDAEALATDWNEGRLSEDQTAGRSTPTVENFATPLIESAGYAYSGMLADYYRRKYKLGYFFYVGGVVSNSRPLCVYLSNGKQPIAFKGLDKTLSYYPQGLFPGTNQDNFVLYRGGYNCRHIVLPVRNQSRIQYNRNANRTPQRRK